MTATLGSFPIFRAFDAGGAPLVGGFLHSYAAGTLTPLATYVDQAGITTNTNPVVLDSTGSANVWFGSAAYKLILKDSTGATLWTVDNYQPDSGATLLRADLASTASAALGDALVGVQYPSTGAARTQHGKNLDSLSSADFPSIQAAITAAAASKVPLWIIGANTITAALTITAPVTLLGASGSSITQSTADTNIINISTTSNVTIRGIAFSGCAGSQGVFPSYIPFLSQIAVVDCSNVTIEGCTFTGGSYHGITNSVSGTGVANTNIRIIGNVFSGWTSNPVLQVGGSAILFYSGWLNCLVQGNRIVGNHGTSHPFYDGILVNCEPSYTQSGMTIRDNYLYGIQDSGIIVYGNTLPAVGEVLDVKILDNHVEYVSSVNKYIATGNHTGNGIYCVKTRDVLIHGNYIKTTNTDVTVGTTLQGGIALGECAGVMTVSDNTIWNAYACGVVVKSASVVSTIIQNNYIYNNIWATAALGLTYRNPINVAQTNNTTIQGNTIICAGSIAVDYPTAVNIAGLSSPHVTGAVVMGNTIQAQAVAFNSGYCDGTILSGNYITQTYASATATLVAFDNGIGATVIGNRFDSTLGTGKSFHIGAVTKLKASTNSFISTGSISLEIDGSGSSGGTVFDESNQIVLGSVSNAAGMGAMVVVVGSAAPSAGTSEKGDRVINSVPAAAGYMGWVCTTAGANGSTSVWKGWGTIQA